jgi:chemotaxis protein histidine kinase CheA
VDQVRGREEVVIKPLPKALRGLRAMPVPRSAMVAWR